VRSGEISAEALDAALGKGEKLTALARSAPSNPHRAIEYRTSWDAFGTHDGGEQEHHRLPTPSEIAGDSPVQPAESRHGPEPDRGNSR